MPTSNPVTRNDVSVVRIPVSVIAAGLVRARPSARSAHLSLTMASPADPGMTVLLMTVPKRVLARAVDRNQLKRVVRECWRQAPRGLRDQSVLVRLWRAPQTFRQWSSGERRRRWREELDQLFLSANAGLFRPARSGMRQD